MLARNKLFQLGMTVIHTTRQKLCVSWNTTYSHHNSEIDASSDKKLIIIDKHSNLHLLIVIDTRSESGSMPE
jgi:hypothetical protein